jgi:hypothetical protein
MKTEIVKFKNIKYILSREQMREIMAGSGGNACGGCRSQYGTAFCVTASNGVCTCTPQPGAFCYS